MEIIGLFLIIVLGYVITNIVIGVYNLLSFIISPDKTIKRLVQKDKNSYDVIKKWSESFYRDLRFHGLDINHVRIFVLFMGFLYFGVIYGLTYILNWVIGGI